MLRSDSMAWQLTLQTIFCLVVLLPATIALGCTLPLMADILSRYHGDGMVNVTRAYACNTAGAVVGVSVATTFLLIAAGVRTSGLVAAGLSAVCAVAAFLLSLRFAVPPRSSGRLPNDDRGVRRSLPADTAVTATTSKPRLAVAGVCGFGTLALEVLYLRMFSLIFHNSTYTFGIVVMVYLLSLALGAWLATSLTRRIPSDRLVAGCSGVGGLLAALSVFVFVGITGLRYFDGGENFTGYLTRATVLITVVVLPPVAVLAWCCQRCGMRALSAPGIPRGSSATQQWSTLWRRPLVPPLPASPCCRRWDSGDRSPPSHSSSAFCRAACW